MKDKDKISPTEAGKRLGVSKTKLKAINAPGRKGDWGRVVYDWPILKK